MVSSPITSWQREGEIVEAVTGFIFLGSKITEVGDCSHEIKRCLMFGREAMINIGTVLKRRDISLLKKVHIVKAMVFPVVMYRVGHKEGWVQKNWCFQTVVLEKTLESPWSSKIKPVNPKGNQPWLFIGSTVEEAEAQILRPSDMNSLLIGKFPDAGKHWRQEKKGMTEDEMVGWHHWLNGHEFKQTPRDSKGQRSLVCCSPWGRSQTWLSDWTTMTDLY